MDNDMTIVLPCPTCGTYNAVVVHRVMPAGTPLNSREVDGHVCGHSWWLSVTYSEAGHSDRD